MAGDDERQNGKVPASEDPRFFSLKNVLKGRRPDDWETILDWVVSDFVNFLENGDNSIWDKLGQQPELETLLTTPMEELGEDFYGHEQTALSFLKNKLQPDEKKGQNGLPTPDISTTSEWEE